MSSFQRSQRSYFDGVNMEKKLLKTQTPFEPYQVLSNPSNPTISEHHRQLKKSFKKYYTASKNSVSK